MDAGKSHCHCLQDREGSFHVHHIVILVLPAENQCLRMVLVLQDEIFSGSHTSQPLKI